MHVIILSVKMLIVVLISTVMLIILKCYAVFHVVYRYAYFIC
jgi:hypothetical protein